MKKILSLLLCLTTAFCALTAVSCKKSAKTDEKLTVYAPDGAPVMALAKMMKTDSAYEYSIISAADVAATFTKAEADFIIAPTNAGMNMSIKGGKYKIAATTSWGNLYLVGTQGTIYSESQSAEEFLNQFANETVYSIGQNAVPDLSFKRLLSEYELLDKVQISASDASNITAGLVAGDISYAILGEPAVTATLTKSQNVKILCSVSEVFKAVMGTDYPQASLFVKASLSNKQINTFLDKLSSSISYLVESEDNAFELGSYLESRGDSTLKGAVVKKSYLRMGQKFVLASDCKQDIITFIGVLGVSYSEADNGGVFYEKGV